MEDAKLPCNTSRPPEEDIADNAEGTSAIIYLYLLRYELFKDRFERRGGLEEVRDKVVRKGIAVLCAGRELAMAGAVEGGSPKGGWMSLGEEMT